MEHKFSVGEIAIAALYHKNKPWWRAMVGSEVTILAVDPNDPEFTYKVSLPFPHPDFPDRGNYTWTRAASLRKRPQQDDNLFTTWFNEHIITDIRPTETQVRIGLKGILQPFGEKAGEG